MSKYVVRFYLDVMSQSFEAEVEADSVQEAESKARDILDEEIQQAAEYKAIDIGFEIECEVDEIVLKEVREHRK